MNKDNNKEAIKNVNDHALDSHVIVDNLDGDTAASTKSTRKEDFDKIDKHKSRNSSDTNRVSRRTASNLERGDLSKNTIKNI